MSTTEQLIASLASSAAPVKPMPAPRVITLRITGILLTYAIILGAILGHRPDLTTQLARPFYLAEIILLATIILSSITGAIILLFPDQYQRPALTRLPFYALAALILLLAIQFFLPADPRMVIPAIDNAMECAICISAAAIVPSAFMFLYLRRGASTFPLLSGIYATLTSSGLGCLMLRLAEDNDSLMHITLWHYIPTLLLAGVGALIGKWLLKW